MTGFGGPAKGKANKSSRKPQLNFQKWFNQAIFSHQTGRLREAESIYKKMIDAGTSDPAVYCNLGIICKNSGRIQEALKYYEHASEHEPDDPKIFSNIGNLYRETGELDQALRYTLKALELDQKSSTIQMNLGGIYRDLGETDQALGATIASIELDATNIEAVQNLKSLASNIKISSANKNSARKAYEILLNRDDFSHRKLCPLFIQQYLANIQRAAQLNPIISDQNQAFHELASEWRFRKSLTLMIPPHQEIEEFLTRLRKEFLVYIQNNGAIPKKLKPLLEALATQCFLNEYVYWQSDEEQQWVKGLIGEIRKSKEKFNQYLPIIGCYTPIHSITARGEDLNNYPINSDEGRAFIETQYREYEGEKAIKAQLSAGQEITDTVSLAVQQMYEENPYPRYQYADHTQPHLAKSTIEFISLETTIANPPFTTEISAPNAKPNILIAGCGSGNQIINASRYKNAHITAIDISKNSLAYAARKCQEYNMHNIQLQQLDILDVNQLQDVYDLIECSGVLHHMHDPAKGLAALNSKLKPGGYIKIGLYSKLARQKVSSARALIRNLGIQSTPEGIRSFRKQIFNDGQHELKTISTLVNDFYTLSECRDLCFHIQEHQFTTASLQNLLSPEHLVFCGFMLPESIKMAYQHQFPDDSDGTSLGNWGEFEEHNPSTFQSMYQFWAYKPSQSSFP
ncbi:methyltransferase domain protein [Synechococcus sp. PROS-U-1]|nr:methyltransferase domain protein [Synechococcus sp. PROS-U-1]